MTQQAADRHPRDRLVRSLSLLDATMLIVASVIGAGIFFTPARVAELLPSPGWIFAAWAAGGLLSLAGALANAELGAMYPRAGGNYVYLREGVHPVAGFLIGWLSFFAIYAGTIAALAAILGETVAGWLGAGEATALACSLGVVLAVSALNYVGVRWGARANNLTSAVKVLALLAFGVAGPLFGEGDASRLVAAAPEGASAITLGAFGLAMSPVLFSYLGWNASVFVGSEIRDPGRNVPRSLFLGLAVCTGVYLLVNAVYLYALPIEALQGAIDAGEAAAGALFGPIGGSLVAGFVFVSVLGTLNATALVGPRVAYAMSLDGLFFGGADHVSRHRTPGAAIWVQAGVTAVLLALLRTFPRALDFTTFAIVLATMADMVALFRLRRLQPDRERPYRTWGHPWLPSLYFCANGGIAFAMLTGATRECAISLGMLAAGLPFYWFFARSRAVGAGSGAAPGPDVAGE